MQRQINDTITSRYDYLTELTKVDPRCYFAHLCTSNFVQITDEESALDEFFETYALSKMDVDHLFWFTSSRAFTGNNPNNRVVNATKRLIEEFLESDYIPFSGTMKRLDISSLLHNANNYKSYSEAVGDA